MIETSIFNTTKNKYQKVKGDSFFCEEIKRTLIIHPDLDSDKLTSVSDLKTGYRLFGINCKKEDVKQEQFLMQLNKFIKHYTIELINREFDRIEKLQEEKKKENV